MTVSYRTANGDKLRALGTAVFKVEAGIFSRFARKATWEATQGLQRDIFLAQRTKVMLTRNLWSEVGLLTGIRGDVLDIVWCPGRRPSAFLEFVVVQ